MGAGAKHRLAFVDRLLATLVHRRHGVTHYVLACWYGVDRSTITRAIGEVRTLLAERGCTVSPDVRLQSLADVVEHLGASRATGIIDGTEIWVRRPAAGRKNRDKFISGKKQAERRPVHGGHGRRGARAVVQPGTTRELRRHHPCPPIRTGQAPGRGACDRGSRPRRLTRAWAPDRRQGGDTTTPQVQEERPRLVRGDVRATAQGTLLSRIRVEHGIAHLKNWRALARHLGCREHMSGSVQAVAGLLSHQKTADLTSTR
nr:transposase family protein [Streptomyces tendae]